MIRFAFYEKPMATNLVIQARSALSEEVKSATLTDEIVRRLRNTSLELNHFERLEIIERACVKMKSSGHSERFIRRAVEKGIKRFKMDISRNNLPEGDKGFKPLYRNSSWRKDLYAKEKVLKRKNWYSDKQDSDQTNRTSSYQFHQRYRIKNEILSEGRKGAT